MSPVATSTMRGDSGKILSISLSALTWRSSLEKKKFSSTFGFKSTKRKKTHAMSAVSPRQTSTGRENGNRFPWAVESDVWGFFKPLAHCFQAPSCERGQSHEQ